MKHALLKFTLFVCTLLYTTTLLSQSENRPLFELASNVYHRDAELKKGVLLKLNQETLQKIWSEKPTQVQIDIPIPNWKPVRLNLEKNDIFADDFKVTIAGALSTTYQVERGLHFKGKIANGGKSMAAVSIFRNFVMGVLAQEDGNYVLGPIEKGQSEDETLYIFYKESDLERQEPIECHTEEDAPKGDDKGQGEKSLTAASGTVRVYFECDYKMYQEKGNNVNTVNEFVTGLFNVVATLYSNESIATQISEIKVWTSQDSYPTTSSSDALTAFGDRMKANGFNGDLAHLLSRNANNLGGIAWIEALCNRNYAFAYSNIGSTYSTYPTYSWTVGAVTHEMGHNLGSRHTHWCGWTGGPIDNCSCVDSGPCTAGPEPAASGGTIMSYCHLRTTSCSTDNPGTNFANGFGPLPGDKIRQVVNQATCLTAGTTCTAPTDAQLSATNITITAARLNSSLTGVSQYDWQYRRTGITTWTDLAQGTAAFIDISGLTASTAYEFQVKVQCTNGVWSAWSVSKTFTTSAAMATCAAPTDAQISAINITAAAARLNSSLTGVSQYDWQYRRTGTTTWTDLAQGTAAFIDISGLTASTAYEFQVKVQCTNGVWSIWSVSKTFTTSAAVACAMPTSQQISAINITATTARLNHAASGFSSYDWRYRRSNTSAWTDLNATTTSFVDITGLRANTNYTFQVRVNCTTGWTSWSASKTFRTLSSTGNITPGEELTDAMEEAVSETPTLNNGSSTDNHQHDLPATMLSQKATTLLPEDFNIKTYPMPARDYIAVEFSLYEENKVQLSLRDLTGRTLQVIPLGTLQAGNYTERLTLENGLRGLYLLEITGNETSKVVKILIQ